MSAIYISETILAGNMGEGWIDANDAAAAYAKFLECEYRALAEKRFSGVEVEIDVDVQQNASGWSRNAIVVGDADELAMSDLERDIADTEYWTQWIESDDAAQYISAE